MIRYFTLLLFIGLAWGQDEYPYFTDPAKQLEFERKRIYINEEKGSVPITFGGGSKTELANPLYPITGRDPQYVSKQSPIFTSVKYYHNFSMERNGVQISELDLLSLLGLEEERNEIVNTHRQRLSEWERRYEEYEKGDKYRIDYDEVSPLTTITGDEITTEYLCYYPCLVMGVFTTLMVLDLTASGKGGISGMVIPVLYFGIPYVDSGTKVKIEKKVKIDPPTKPTLNQSLSNNQIKSLANTYNHNLYAEINGK